MRELVRSVSKDKPLIAVAERETEHGGLTEDEARVQCVASGNRFDGWGFRADVPPAATLADALLGPAHGSAACAARSGAALAADDGKPIVYERVGAFQQTMLRLIVQRLAPQREMYLPGELAPRKQPLPPPAGEFHVWCSRHNPGVRTLIEEVRHYPCNPEAKTTYVSVSPDALRVAQPPTDEGLRLGGRTARHR